MDVFVAAKEVETPARFIDARFDLADKEAGRAAYTREHIAGAVYMDLEQDLSDMTKEAGRHPMPEREQLVRVFEEAGLQLTDRIYIYDQGAAPFAARAWWMLVYAGFTNVRIVNGGFEALKAAGFIVTANKETFEPTTITPNWQDALYADRTYVKDIVDGKREALLVDARAHVRYLGEHEPLDPIAGHIPTAANFDWEQLKEGNELVVTDEVMNIAGRERELVVYCGSGVTASPLYTVLKQAGYENVKLYVGSYSDWIREHDVATGEEATL